MPDNSFSEKSSFRDPSGFLFWKSGEIYRQINPIYKEHYEHLINSGLYERLTNERLLVAHEEVNDDGLRQNEAFKIIKPEVIPFISYPYEWCFSQLKDAALATLKIQRIALEYGMTLKDASAYNIQFKDGSPMLVDTLSFEKYTEGKPWVAYRQFCQHFFAPLALMAMRDIRLGQLMRIYIDGIPLDLASRLLPLRSFVRFSFVSHIHMHAKAQTRFGQKNLNVKKYKVGKTLLFGIIDNLESAISKFNWKPEGTEWAEYYEDTNYTSQALERKKTLIDEYLDLIKPKSVWDLGANTGLFSRLASTRGINTIAFDIDPSAVEKNYLECKSKKETHLLPLILDLTNPSPDAGWANEERMSLIRRGPADMVFALALIHHLAISNNLPFTHIADFLSRICRYLVIEYVPKEDSQVQRLLRTREDIFTSYNVDDFELSFKSFFILMRKDNIKDSKRVIYLYKLKE